MKLKLILLLLSLIVFSTIATTKFERRRHKIRRNFGTNLYQLAIGITKELIGDVDINKCLPNSWKSANSSVGEEGVVESKIASESSTWSNIGSMIGAALNVVCLAKDLISDVIKYFTENIKKRFRRYLRLFLARKTSRRFRIRGIFSSAANWISDKASKAASEISKGVSTAYITLKNSASASTEWVGKQVDKIADSIKEVITGLIDKCVNAFEKIRGKLLEFFKSELMLNIISFVACLKTLKEAAGNVTKLIEGFAFKATNIANFPVGWIKIVIGLICAWENLKTGIDYLILGVKSTNAQKKYNYYGRFIGKIIYTIGTS